LISDVCLIKPSVLKDLLTPNGPGSLVPRADNHQISLFMMLRNNSPMSISNALHPVGAGPKGIGDPPSFGIFDSFGGALLVVWGLAAA
jgi:hypothetical protein